MPLSLIAGLLSPSLDTMSDDRGRRLQLIHGFEPGFTRVKAAGGFAYLQNDRSPVNDQADLERIAGLAIPPAWKDVWIAPEPAAHLQATGIDARGRKQYLYH